MKFFTVFILLLTILGLVEGNQADDLETFPDNFPWMVLLSAYNESTNDRDNVCGGSLISDMFVITAAHCFDDGHMDVTHFSITAGIKNVVNRTEETEQIRSISEIIVHPEYDNTSFLNDLAIVRVSPAFNFKTWSVAIISLSNITSFENMTLVTIGWGIFNQAATPETAKPLEKIIVQENIECTQNQSINSTTQLCVTVTENPKCSRDNGSPLMVYLNDSDSYQLVGVASHRDGCPTERLFTLIEPFSDWIGENVFPSSTTSTTLQSTTPSPTTSTTSTSTSVTTTAPITTTIKNNAIVIESKLFLVSIICMLFNVVLIN